jgi:hypothetical protein
MYNNGLPIANYEVQDLSGASAAALATAPDNGLYVPFQFIMAERGVPGKIYFGAAAELTPRLGAQTFVSSSKYFNNATLFLNRAMSTAGCCVMRLADAAAAYSTLGVFLEVTSVDVPQYQKDAQGNRLLDVDGNFVPLLNAGTPVTEPGIHVKWVVRVLTAQESYRGLTVATVTNGSVTTTTYPVFGLRMYWPGGAGNRQGFSLSSTKTLLSAVANDVKSVIYRFAPRALATDVSTTSGAIVDRLGNSYTDFSFKQRAVYSRTNTNYALGYALRTNYVDTANGYEPLLPYDLVTYGANIATVGAAVIAASPELAGTDPYMIDLISGQDLDGLYYDHLEVDATAASVVSDSVVQYAKGGSDGDTSFAKLQELIRDFFNGTDHGEFTYLLKHPFTHYADPGFSIETKYAMMGAVGLRRNLKVDVSTQDTSLPLNTAAQDLSAGQALQSRALLYPDSVLNGVPCHRIGVYAHAGYLTIDDPYVDIVPFTLARQEQRCQYDSGQRITGSAGGLDNGRISIFQAPNWSADDPAQRLLFWESAINTVIYGNRTDFFNPSARTVYNNDTSLLSSDEVSDRFCYVIKLCDRKWAQYVGIREDLTELFPQMEKELQQEIRTAMGVDNISGTVSFFQSASDANLGYAYSANVSLSGVLPARQFNFTLTMLRQAATAAA